MGALLEIGAVPAVGDAEFAFFSDLIHARTGIALKESKRSLMAARLSPRVRALGLDSFAAYRRFVEAAAPSHAEWGLMINCITTNKTSFFREEAHFAFLADRLLAAGREGQTCFRIWSAACSTGEEPYSLAMTALQAKGTMKVRILASDLDTDVLARAQAAVYPIDSLAEMDQESKRRYFLRGCGEGEGSVQVKPKVRDLVTFRHINLVEEPWPIRTRFDAIFCRNVIIYFDRETQRRLFERLAQYLAPGGLLFVGHAESLFWLDELLVPVTHSVYRVRSSAPPKQMP
jgi:chemotaxis protein methyltransferase CheR